VDCPTLGEQVPPLTAGLVTVNVLSQVQVLSQSAEHEQVFMV
jgi:hypothetical protein